MPGQIGLPGPVTGPARGGLGEPGCRFQPKPSPWSWGRPFLPKVMATPRPGSGSFSELPMNPLSPAARQDHQVSRFTWRTSPSAQEPLAKGTIPPSGQSVPLGAGPQPLDPLPRERGSGNAPGIILLTYPRSPGRGGLILISAVRSRVTNQIPRPLYPHWCQEH